MPRHKITLHPEFLMLNQMWNSCVYIHTSYWWVHEIRMKSCCTKSCFISFTWHEQIVEHEHGHHVIIVSCHTEGRGAWSSKALHSSHDLNGQTLTGTYLQDSKQSNIFQVSANSSRSEPGRSRLCQSSTKHKDHCEALRKDETIAKSQPVARNLNTRAAAG